MAGERGAPRVAAQAATAPDNDDGRESEVPAPAPRGASSAGGAGEDEGEGAGETKEEPPPDGSLSPAPPPLTRIFVGMVTACCSPQHGRRRDIHRAIYTDYLEGRVGERPPLPAGAQEARGKRAVDLRFVVGHPEGDPDFDTVEDASLRRELKEVRALVCRALCELPTRAKIDSISEACLLVYLVPVAIVGQYEDTNPD